MEFPAGPDYPAEMKTTAPAALTLADRVRNLEERANDRDKYITSLHERIEVAEGRLNLLSHETGLDEPR